MLKKRRFSLMELFNSHRIQSYKALSFPFLKSEKCIEGFQLKILVKQVSTSFYTLFSGYSYLVIAYTVRLTIFSILETRGFSDLIYM
jgi:hypothetical protein